MPTIELRSPTSGRTFQAEVNGTPTVEDVQHILAQYDAAYPKTADESMASALKKSSQAGVFPEQKADATILQNMSGDAQALTMGLGQGSTLGLEGALFNRYVGTDAGSASSPEFTRPYTYMAGEIAGGLLPWLAAPLAAGGKMLAGRAAAPVLERGVMPFAKSLGVNAAKALAMFTGLGGASGAINEINKPESTAGDIAGGGLEGVKQALESPSTYGMALGAGIIPPLAGTKARMAANTADLGTNVPFNQQTGVKFNPKAMPEQQRIVSFVTQFPEENRKANSRVRNGEYLPVIDQLRPYFEEGSGAEGFVNAADVRMREMRGQIDPIIQNFNPQNAPPPDYVRSLAEQKLAKDVHNPDTRAALLNNFSEVFDNLAPDNMLDKAYSLNRKAARGIERGGIETADQAHALNAVREAVSETIHQMLDFADPSGNASRTYSQSGMLGELAARIEKNAEDLTTDRMNASVAPGGVVSAVKRLIMPIGSKTYKGVKLAQQAAERYGPGDLGALNDQINRLFELGPSTRVPSVAAPSGANPPPGAPPNTPWNPPPLASPQASAQQPVTQQLIQWLNGYTGQAPQVIPTSTGGVPSVQLSGPRSIGPDFLPDHPVTPGPDILPPRPITAQPEVVPPATPKQKTAAQTEAPVKSRKAKTEPQPETFSQIKEEAPSNERIIATAVLNPKTGEITASPSKLHAELYEKAGIETRKMPSGDKYASRGFITSSGRYVDAEEARSLAKKSEQIGENDLMQAENANDSYGKTEAPSGFSVQGDVWKKNLSETPPAPPSKYTPDIQEKLDAAEADYKKRVELIKKTKSDDTQYQQSRLKGAGMRYAAEKRQITGELTAKEAAAKEAHEASNFRGKEVGVKTEDGTFKGIVVNNVFGKVRVKFSDGSVRTIDPSDITEVPRELYQKIEPQK